MTVQQFIDDLGLDLAAEEVGENPDLPEEMLRGDAVHYRVEIIRYDPYRAEHFIVTGNGNIIRPDPRVILVVMAVQLGIYRAFPEPADWCEVMRVPLSDGIVNAWPTFARDEAKLRQLFGEDFERFLALSYGGE